MVRATETTQHGRCYVYSHTGAAHSFAYLRPAIEEALSRRSWPSPARALDFGCGSGASTQWLTDKGFTAFGVDISATGIELAKRAFPSAQFSMNISKEALLSLEPFDLVLCVEVIAHCYAPSRELEKMYECLSPGGTLILSTPYHGYWKNLAMAATGRLASHLDTQWGGAYVHFFDIATITRLLAKAKFCDIRVARVGRIPPLARSIVLTCSKPIR